MKLKITKWRLAALLSAASMAASTTQAATFTFTGGNLNSAANWQDENGNTGAFPVTGDIAMVNVNSTFPATPNAGGLSAGGDIFFGGGTVLTADIDVVASLPTSLVFNDVTLNVADDIFAGTGNFIFNAGSVSNVNDDFEANGIGGTITVNGGTHAVGLNSPNDGNFGAQNGATLNFLGGTVTADVFRTTQNGPGTVVGTINVGGDATLTADSIDLASAGVFDFSSAWTGSLTIDGFDATDWEDLVIASTTLDGVAIDTTVFADNFEVTGNTLSLVPEPSSALLGSFGILVLLRRRR